MTARTASENPYTIEWARFEFGERLPLLVRRSTGLPIEAPTYWIAASERPLNKAAATLEKQLRHLFYLYLWGDTRRTTPEDLIRSPGFLSLEQLNDLDRFCRQPLAAAVAAARDGRVSEEIALVRFQQRKLRKLGGATASADIGNRLSTVHSYLTFASFACAARMDPGGEARRVYEAARTAILGVLRARAKAFLPARSTGEPREGLRAEQRQRLLEAITPGHPENPWEPEVQNRNQLVVRLLYELGMRRGEVLCLRVGDVKLTADGALLTVVRRPQDPDDPRQPKPQVKTLGRELLIGVTLRDLFVGYLADRRTLPGARRHPFLFVSGTNGAPLSVWSMTKMFKALRERVPGLSEELSAHVLRHDWNDRFSEMSDRAAPARTEIDATKEERARAYAMGWSNPATATRYTKRWTREAANKRSLDMQERRDIVVERTSSQLGLLEQRGNTKKNA